MIAAYKPEHPILPVMSRAAAAAYVRKHGVVAYNDYLRRRNAAIRRSEQEPFHYVYKLPQWLLCDLLLGFITVEDFLADKRVPARWKESEALVRFCREAELYVLMILGGNRSAKTEYMIWRAVQELVNYPEITIWVMHEVERMSIEYHQERVWRYLPEAWKDAGKGRGGRDTTYISWTQQNGFAGGKLTGPEGQSMVFLYYTMDPVRAIEGGELGSPHVKGRLGYVADEHIPLTWFKRMRARTSTRAAKGLIGFTPTEGYSDTVAEFQDGSSVVYGELADPDVIEVEGKRRAPLLRRCVDRGKALVNFHTRYNPFEDYQAFKKRHLYDTVEQKLIKFYGLTNKGVSAAFPRFDERVHVVKREVIADWKEVGIVEAFKFAGTNYLIVDPGKSGLEGKNWALGWLRVDVYGRYWVYREWPCEGIYVPNWGMPGPWAEPGAATNYKYDGLPGEGSKAMNFTLEDMKIEQARLEGWKDAEAAGLNTLDWDEANGSVDAVFLRFMDSRFANTPVQSHLVNTTLIEMCADAKMYFVPTYSQEGLGTIREGTQMIANALGNPDDLDESGVCAQPPELFICEDCTNFIFAMKVWTGKDGSKGATKDWVDLLRYAYMAQIYHADAAETARRRPGLARGYGVTGGRGRNPVAAAKKGKR